MAKIYRIPVNFKKGGYVFNGLIETRKAVEAVCGALIGLIICQILPLKNIVLSILLHFLFMAVFAIVGFIGVRGEPFSVFFMNYMRWRKIRKKPYIYNPNGMTFAGSPTLRIFNEQDAGDVVADWLASIKAKFAKERPEYIEGETFQFAEDPLLTRLQSIEEQQIERAAEAAQERAERTEKDLDVESLMEDIASSEAQRGGETDEKA